jgi:hypothetical protein
VSKLKKKVLVTRKLPDDAMKLLYETCEVELNPYDRVMTEDELIQGLSDKQGLLSLLCQGQCQQLSPLQFSPSIADFIYSNRIIQIPSRSTAVFTTVRISGDSLSTFDNLTILDCHLSHSRLHLEDDLDSCEVDALFRN